MAKKTIAITLYMSELIYDVQNKTYLTGRSRTNGTNHEEVANMQANDDDENANQILRSIGNAFANLKTKLSEFINETGTSANDKLLSATSNLTISLNMPPNYNSAGNDTISSALHHLFHSNTTHYQKIWAPHDNKPHEISGTISLPTFAEYAPNKILAEVKTSSY